MLALGSRVLHGDPCQITAFWRRLHNVYVHVRHQYYIYFYGMNWVCRERRSFTQVYHFIWCHATPISAVGKKKRTFKAKIQLYAIWTWGLTRSEQQPVRYKRYKPQTKTRQLSLPLTPLSQLIGRLTNVKTSKLTITYNFKIRNLWKFMFLFLKE